MARHGSRRGIQPAFDVAKFIANARLPLVDAVSVFMYVLHEIGLRLEKRKFLILREHFQRTFTDTAVTRVTRIDSRVEGGIIGFVAGFVPVVLAPCDSHDDGGYCELGKIIFGPLSGALGAGIGMLIDGSINKVVYRTTAPVRPVTITVSPLLKPKSAGASLNLRF